MSSVQSILPGFGRRLIGILFVFSGIGKLSDPAGTIGYIQSAHLPLPQIAYGVALTANCSAACS